MALVQAPRTMHRNPQTIHFVECDPQRSHGALQYRTVGEVEGETGFLHQHAGVFRLGQSAFGQVDVGPAGEAVFLVPGGFTVAQQYDLVHGSQQRVGVRGRGDGAPQTRCRSAHFGQAKYFIMERCV
jgi:hypothetical protein